MEMLNSNIKYVYFVGIGGIGMSAIARYYHTRKCFVAGYDKTPSPLTHELEHEEMQISYIDEISTIPSEIIHSSKEEILIVYTPAIPKDSKILNYFKDNGYTMMKRAQVLGLLTNEHFSICIAGTHGKTTTTSLTAHLFEQCGLLPTVFAGGILSNYNTNFLNHPEGNITISEADEFDRSFLWLKPDMAVITSVDADHLDIYGDIDSFADGFKDFSKNVKENGFLLLSEAAAKTNKIDVPYETYGFSENCTHKITFLGVKDHKFEFKIESPISNINGIYLLPMAGLHNISNASAAIILAGKKGCNHSNIAKALVEFKGVKRRFEWIINNDKISYIDDYAHHPTEIKAAISAARLLFPNKKLTVAFQPHLFSRTRDFIDGFAQELSKVDELILLDIYPARELPIEGVSSELLLDKCSVKDKKIVQKEDLANYVAEHKDSLEVLLTLGAGDIDRSVEPIKAILSNE